MGKGKKILTSIIIIIVVLILAIVGIYYVSFRPKVETTPVSANVPVNVAAIAKKFVPSDISLSSNGISATSNVKLTSPELTNLAAYAVSKSPSATKYITGIKVSPENNNLDVYVTGKLDNVSSQAKLTFSVKSQDGSAVIHYEGGKVGFLSIPQSLIFDKLKSNDAITVDKAKGDIIVNVEKLKGLSVTNMSVNNSELDIDLNAKIKAL